MRKALIFMATIAVSTAVAAQPTILNFELCTSSCAIGTSYVAQGVTFTPNTHNVWGGNSNGNPGNWGLEGTNGPAFLGLNGNPSYAVTMSFATPKTSVSMDLSRSNGSAPGDAVTVTAYSGATPVATQTITFAAINTWTTVTLTGAGIDSIVATGSGSAFHPFGIDNVVLDAGVLPVPTLSGWGLLALAALLAVGAFVSLRRL